MNKLITEKTVKSKKWMLKDREIVKYNRRIEIKAKSLIRNFLTEVKI